MNRILHVTAEAAPYARTGGLGDASMGLCRALARGSSSRDVVLVTPRYGVSKGYEAATWWEDHVEVRVGRARIGVGVRELVRGPGEPRILFVEHDELFGNRAGVYADQNGYFGDNGFRYAVLSAAALEISKRIWPDGGHDVLHAHDWHAALAVLYARLDDAFRMHASVLTIHNLAHQGEFAPDMLRTFGLPDHWLLESVLEKRGTLNVLKGAIALADRVTAVSPRYAYEITTPEGGFGLDAHLSHHRDKLRGVVNGIDTEAYDPTTDGALPRQYGLRGAAEGKAAARRAVCTEFGIEHEDDERAPLFGVVSRFDSQKGLDVFFRVVPELVAWGARVVILGQGERPLEDQAQLLAERFRGRVGTRILFDDGAARRVYAASSFVVVPSRFEPCGLSQLYAMRYGAMPIVARTGGLLDTVASLDVVDLESAADGPEDDRRGPGFLVTPGNEISLLDACVRACELSTDLWRMQRVRARLMARDFSWARSAAEIADVYASIR